MLHKSCIQHSATVLCVVVGALMGCGGDSPQSRLEEAIPNRTAVVPVSGVVLINGSPVLELTIRLVQADAETISISDPKTLTDAQGRFTFTTYLDGDGVPPGKYRMLVEHLERHGSSGWGSTDKLGNRYNYITDPATTIEVKEGAPAEGLKFDLDISGKPANSPPPYTRPVSGKPIKKGP